jgi:predicted Zn-dependent protease
MAGARSRLIDVVAASCLVLSLAWPLFGQSTDLASESERAKEFMASGQPEKAIPIYRELVRALPNNVGVITDLGIALEMGGHDREAIKQFNVALKLDPQYLNARLFLGLAHLEVGKPQDAIAQLEKVVDAQPTNELARWKLGEAFSSLGNYARAEEEYRGLCDLNPRNAKGWYGLGHSYLSLSLSTVDKLRRLAPDSGYALALSADVYSRQQQFPAAVQLYREAMQKLPALPGLHVAVAEAYRAAGHPDWAVVEGKREPPTAPSVCKTQPLACDFQEAHYDQLLNAAARQPSAESYYWESKAYERLALAAFDHLRELPRGVEFYELIAETDLAQGEFQQCVKDWQEVLKLAPNNPKIKKNLAIAYRRAGDQQAAQQLLQKVVESQPEDSEANYLLGDTLLSLHQPSQAVPFLEKSVRADPSLLVAQVSLAKAYLGADRPQEAIPHLKAALPTDKNGALHFELARAYERVGQTKLAEEMIKRSKEIRAALAEPVLSPQLEPPTPQP